MDDDIRSLPVFLKLSPAHADLLAPLAETYSCAAGRVIIQQGSAADYIHIIKRGRVEIVFKPYDGAPITVHHAQAGDVFGWSAVMGSRKYTSSAVAIEAVESTRVRGDRLRKVCREHPEAAKEILNCLADAVGSRWKDAHKHVRTLLAHGLK
jgi:CRP-like cAMP-binding protein